jgi:hypothetical protein
MRRLVLAAAAFVAACSPQAQQKSPPPAPTKEMTAEEIDAASHEGPVGWLDADGAGETALVWRAGQNAVGFTLTCRKADSALVVTAESTGTTAAPLKANSPATLLLGATPFTGVVSPDDGLLTMSMKLPVTPALLSALTSSTSARVLVGESFMDTGPDGGPHFKTLATSCAAITGVAPRP